MTQIVHRLIAKTAKEIAFSVYEVLASVDKFYKAWPNQRRFVAKNWRYFIGDARNSLTVMLRPVTGTEKDPDGPKYYYSQHIHDEIFEALVLEGEMKSAPPIDLNELRRNAGFEPADYAKGHRHRLDA